MSISKLSCDQHINCDSNFGKAAQHFGIRAQSEVDS